MWCQVQATSAVTGHGCPLIRSKHAMCVSPDGHIYLYGGKSLANQALRDLWRFDTGQNQWEEVVPRTDNANYHRYDGQYRHLSCEEHSVGYSSSASSSSSSSTTSPPLIAEERYEPPPALQEHTIVAAKNKLYIFGGEVGYASDETPLWTFDLATARWSKFSPKSSHPALSPTSMYATSRPLGRRGHTAVLYKNLMCIYGGYQDLKGSSSELWTLNLDNFEWTIEGTNRKRDSIPAARHAHSSVVYKDSMYIYGGMTGLQVRGDFWAWNFKSREWSRIKSIKNPRELSYHSAVVALDSMFIYGGERSNGNNTNELWRYRFGTQTWEHIVVEGIIPGCRTRHVAIANSFLNFGFNTGHDWDTPVDNCNQKKSSHKKHNKVEKETSFITDLETKLEIRKKSISMCFEDSKQDKVMQSKITKSNSFKHNYGHRTDNGVLCASKLQNQFDKHEQKNDVTNGNYQTTERLCTQTESVSNIENDQNILNKSSANEPTINTKPVRMRPRRPVLQKQRPYSDFYGVPPKLNEIYPGVDEFDVNGDHNDKQFKRRSVQESMSYYSLCFPTPPSSLKLNHSPSIAPMSPLKTAQQANYAELVFGEKSTTSKTESNNETNETPDQEVVVRRRENSSIKRRMRRANLELQELTHSYMLSSADTNNYNAYYSLSLDISPDFEKELKCTTVNSTPSNDFTSNSSGPFGSENDEMTHIDLDILEDYLEPEEMLEIVTSNDDDEISPTLKLKTIEKTPFRVRNPPTNSNTKKTNYTGMNKAVRQSSTNSVSHSSSGYQSLVMTESNGTGSFDYMSDPSLSNSSSFVEPQQSICESKQDDLFYGSMAAHTINENKTTTTVKRATKAMECIELRNLRSPIRQANRSTKEPTIRSRSLERTLESKGRLGYYPNRMLHWEPNIKEVIKEIIVPGSPAVAKYSTGNNEDRCHKSGTGDLIKKKSFMSIRGKKACNGVQQHWQLCMYVFGGREEGVTGVLNKQSMTIWKLYM